jgi:hypothetical protein
MQRVEVDWMKQAGVQYFSLGTGKADEQQLAHTIFFSLESRSREVFNSRREEL